MHTVIYLGILLFWGLTLAAFLLIGYLWGGKPHYKANKQQKADELRELERLRREYGNFLSYDGSEQEEIL